MTTLIDNAYILSIATTCGLCAWLFCLFLMLILQRICRTPSIGDIRMRLVQVAVASFGMAAGISAGTSGEMLAYFLLVPLLMVAGLLLAGLVQLIFSAACKFNQAPSDAVYKHEQHYGNDKEEKEGEQAVISPP